MDISVPSHIAEQISNRCLRCYNEQQWYGENFLFDYIGDSNVGNTTNDQCDETDGSCISKGFIMILTLFSSDERDILLDETSGICVNDECEGGIYDGQPCSDTDTCDGVISWLKFK